MSQPKERQSVNLIRVAREENSLEKRFVTVWRAQERIKILAYLLDPERGRSKPDPKTPTDRDCQVAETVVQWLGSTVGQGFIEEVMKGK